MNILNSGMSEMISLLYYHIFYRLISACYKKSITEIFDKDFYNSIFLGGFTIVFYTMFMENYILDFIKNMNSPHKEKIIYIFFLIGLIYIFKTNHCDDNKKISKLIKKKKN